MINEALYTPRQCPAIHPVHGRCKRYTNGEPCTDFHLIMVGGFGRQRYEKWEEVGTKLPEQKEKAEQSPGLKY